MKLPRRWPEELSGLDDATKANLLGQGVAVGTLGAASVGLHIIIKLVLPRSIARDGVYFAFYRIDTRIVSSERARRGISIV